MQASGENGFRIVELGKIPHSVVKAVPLKPGNLLLEDFRPLNKIFKQVSRMEELIQ